MRDPKQLQLKMPIPSVVDVDGIFDEGGQIRYIGKAVQQFDGSWQCLADVYGCLCRVEVSMRFK